jgi:hypothetical protein
MGKGLSELQKNILKLAYRNRCRRSGTGDTTNSEVLIEVYNFPAHPPGPWHTSGQAQIFYLAEIVVNRYRSGSVSVAKAFNRLAKRDLAFRGYSHGIILTEEGTRTANTLSPWRENPLIIYAKICYCIRKIHGDIRTK